LKNPGKYQSVSAFAPIANPINCPWGQKAFKGYFGEDQEAQWKAHDATELVKKWKGPLDVLIDVVCYIARPHFPIQPLCHCADGVQGTGDNFYKQGQLLPENFESAIKEAGDGEKEVTLRIQPDYDHSYFFISTFADDHLAHAAKYLFAQCHLDG
jgi:S-formylglutathione hydrolase FrmB